MVAAAALQYVAVAGHEAIGCEPAAFDEAVAQIAHVTALVDHLVTSAPEDRTIEAAKARARPRAGMPRRCRLRRTG